MKKAIFYSIFLVMLFTLSCDDPSDVILWEGYRFTFIHDNQETANPIEGEIIYFNYVKENRQGNVDSLKYKLGSGSTVLHSDNPLTYALYIGSPGDTIKVKLINENSENKSIEINHPITIEEIVDQKTFAERQIRKSLGLIPDTLLSEKQIQSAKDLAYQGINNKDKLTHIGNGNYIYIIDRGNEMAREGELLAVYYIAMLQDGLKIVDNNFENNDPMVINARSNEVIQGWQKALEYIPRGSRVLLFVPSDQAYGKEGKGSIPPDSDLVFLIDIY